MRCRPVFDETLAVLLRLRRLPPPAPLASQRAALLPRSSVPSAQMPAPTAAAMAAAAPPAAAVAAVLLLPGEALLPWRTACSHRLLLPALREAEFAAEDRAASAVSRSDDRMASMASPTHEWNAHGGVREGPGSSCVASNTSNTSFVVDGLQCCMCALFKAAAVAIGSEFGGPRTEQVWPPLGDFLCGPRAARACVGPLSVPLTGVSPACLTRLRSFQPCRPQEA